MNTSNQNSARGAACRLALAFTMVVPALAISCMPQSPVTEGASVNITVYAFSIMKEVLDKSIYPDFAAKWKREHGVDVRFTSSYAGSETITNQILQGVGADIAILSIERDADRLRAGGAITADWRTSPHGSIINKTPFIILVRKGNPKKISDFVDLVRPGIKVIHPDPISSGGAQWSLLAIYGSELAKSEKETGKRDERRALLTLQGVWRNVISTPGSAREARTQFETGFGDALITYELEGLLMKEAGAAIDVIVPKSTIFSEHPAVIIDRNVTPAERQVVDAFLQYLWTEEAQRSFVRFHLRSVTNEALNGANSGFAQIEMPLTVSFFGGWARAYPEVIERTWRDQVQKIRP